MDYGQMIEELYAKRRSAIGGKWGMEKITRLCELLGNPQDRLKAITIAGSKGKGSVSTMVESALRTAGFKTGLTISPDVDGYAERFQISGKPVSNARILEVYQIVRPQAEKISGISFFEITIAMALLLFAEEKVDYAVLEVGLGGRLDATNVCTPLVAAITNISLEHTENLGNSIEKIAWEKAGIIKNSKTITVTTCDGAALEVIRKKCADVGSKLVEVNGKYEGRIGMRGEFQKRNAALACAAVSALCEADGIKISEESIALGIDKAFIGGRMETISQNPLVVMDGAHNPAAMTAIEGDVRKIIMEKNVSKTIIVLAIMADKNYEEMLAAIAPLANEIVATQTQFERCLSANGLAKAAGKYCPKVTVIADAKQAFEYAKKNAGENGFVLVTGSLYLLGEVRGKRDLKIDG
ncbi:bifunctional folylpolyglutamate synthase/dihydrofolate synthase [Candidatus Micrarchaeota archaeon]|nr:bifunctional folylpolyglutamate synthase/dihydrofolate synthase [Candidatus Micrarchaeota archaeon]